MEGPNKGINELAKVIDRRMREHSGLPPAMDFGTVKKNGSLRTDSFPKTIAKGDYSLLEGFEYGGQDTRVLVAWVGNEAVVIGSLAGA